MTITRPFTSMQEIGLTELVGINETVANTNYGDEVSVTIGDGPNNEREVSGEFLSFMFYSTEDGSGAVQTPAGRLLIFDTAPTIAANDTAITVAEATTLVGQVRVAVADWTTHASTVPAATMSN
jgi:hypothetical protein